MLHTIQIEPVGYVENSRNTPQDDCWADIESRIILSDNYPVDSLKGIDQFSHIEVFYFFHKVGEHEIMQHYWN